MDLRDRVDAELARVSTRKLSDYDIALEYSIKLHTKNGVRHDVSDVIKMPSIMHPRAYATAPGRFEQLFLQEIFTPVNNVLYDLMDDRTPGDNPADHVLRLGNIISPTEIQSS